MLTDRILKDYGKSLSRCPFCKSEDIEGMERNSDDNYTTQRVVCHACGEEWEDIYQWAGIEYEGKCYFPNEEGSKQ